MPTGLLTTMVAVAMVATPTIAYGQLDVRLQTSSFVVDDPSGETLVVTSGAAGDAEIAIYDSPNPRDRVLLQSATLRYAAPGQTHTLTLDGDYAGKSLYVVAEQGELTASAGVTVPPQDLAYGRGEPADFDAFWDARLTELASVPLDAVETRLPERDGDGYEAYRVSAQIGGGKSVLMHVAVPATNPKVGPVFDAAARFPAVVSFPASGTGVYGEWDANAWMPAQRVGAIGVTVSIHEGGTGEAGYVSRGINKPATAYMTDAVKRCVRALDYVLSHPRFGGEVLVRGDGQGGGLAKIVAGLRPEAVTHVFTALDAMCTFGTRPGEPEGWPRYVNLGADYADVAYLDAALHSRRIRARNVTSVYAMRDATAPPSAALAAFNQLPASVPRTIALKEDVDHNGDRADFAIGFVDYANRYLTSPDVWYSRGNGEYAVRDVAVTESEDGRLTAVYSVDGTPVAPGSGRWTVASGPGGITFASPTSETTTYSVSAGDPEDYVVAYQASEAPTYERYYATVGTHRLRPRDDDAGGGGSGDDRTVATGLTALPLALDFGDVEAGSNAVREVVLTNASGVDLVADGKGAAGGGGFYAGGSFYAGRRLPAGASTSFEVGLAVGPGASGSRASSLSVSFNAGAYEVTVPLSAMIVDASDDIVAEDDSDEGEENSARAILYRDADDDIALAEGFGLESELDWEDPTLLPFVAELSGGVVRNFHQQNRDFAFGAFGDGWYQKYDIMKARGLGTFLTVSPEQFALPDDALPGESGDPGIRYPDKFLPPRYYTGAFPQVTAGNYRELGRVLGASLNRNGVGYFGYVESGNEPWGTRYPGLQGYRDFARGLREALLPDIPMVAAAMSAAPFAQRAGENGSSSVRRRVMPDYDLYSGLTLHPYPEAVAGGKSAPWQARGFVEQVAAMIAFRDSMAATGNGKLPIDVTEIGWQSNKVGEQAQATYEVYAWLWSNLHHIKFYHYGNRDPYPGQFDWCGFIDPDDRRKPLYYAFRDLQRDYGDTHVTDLREGEREATFTLSTDRGEVAAVTVSKAAGHAYWYARDLDEANEVAMAVTPLTGDTLAVDARLAFDSDVERYPLGRSSLRAGAARVVDFAYVSSSAVRWKVIPTDARANGVYLARGATRSTSGELSAPASATYGGVAGIAPFTDYDAALEAVVFLFGEDVAGGDTRSDYEVAGASIASVYVRDADRASRYVQLTPDGSGDAITLRIKPGVARGKRSGRTNLAVAQVLLPGGEIAVTPAEPQLLVDGPAAIRFDFALDVDAFDPGRVTVTGAQFDSVTYGATAREALVYFTPSGVGNEITVAIDDGFAKRTRRWRTVASVAASQVVSYRRREAVVR